MSHLPFAELATISFRMLDDAGIIQQSCVTVTDNTATNGVVAVSGGVCDLRLGTFDHKTACGTCGQIAPQCPGHPGHIPAVYPVLSPLFIPYAVRWLRVLCHGCSSPIVVPGHDRYNDLGRWYDAIKAYMSNHEIVCAKCKWSYLPVEPYMVGTALIVYIRAGAARTGIMRERHSAQRADSILWPHKIKQIFARVPPELVAQMRLPASSHPSACVWSYIPVSMNNLRPELRKHNGEVTSRNDITAFLISIADCNSKIPRDKPHDELVAAPESREYIIKLGYLVYSMIAAQNSVGVKINGADKLMVSLMARQKGKLGRIRGTLLGRRSTRSARSFITCNTDLRHDEVGIPMRVATSQYCEEVVCQYNFTRCLALFMSSEYPRARKIMRGDRTYDVERLRTVNGSGLQIGDIIMRDIVDGDMIVLNRQPSLEPSSLTALRARVIDGINTFQLNVEDCYLFNADFDGDAMNAYFPRNLRSAHEVSVLASPEQFFIAQKNGLNKMGQSQDALVGLSGLSETATEFSFDRAAQLFADLPLVPQLSAASGTISGRGILSAAFLARNYLINYEGTPTICSSNYEAYRKYNPQDTKVVVRNGVFESGVIDQSSVGRDRSGGILRQVYDMLGPESALRCSELLQRLALRYLYHKGLTISMSDLLLLPSNRENIRRIERAILADSYAHAERLDAGQITAPVGQTVSTYYESTQLNTLRHASKFVADVMASINFEESGFCRMIATGARGKFTNFMSVAVSIGQTTINGERHPEIFNDRCLPFYTRYDRDPQARGYIRSSYIDGLTTEEWFAHAVEARLQLIAKSLSTAAVGAINRQAIKAFEALIVDNLRRLINAGNYVELLYGGDGCDPKYLSSATIPTCAKGMDSTQFRELYWCGAGLTGDDLAAANAEYEQLLADRVAYTSAAVRSVASNAQIQYTHEVQIPIDVAKIIHDVQAASALDAAALPARGAAPVRGTATGEKFSAAKAIAIVQKLVDRLPYVLYNEEWRKRRGAISDMARTSVTQTVIHLRAWLCVRSLQKLGITLAQLRVIRREVYERYSSTLIDYGKVMGIIAAQSVSEPMTQMVLNSAHRVGAQAGGSDMKRVKEILELVRTHEVDALGHYVGNTPLMYVQLLDKYASDEGAVREFAASMEMIKLRAFTKNHQVLFEDYGKPVHPDYRHEVELFRQFEKYNDAGRRAPTNLSRWCIRIECDKYEMFQKQIHYGNEIIERLRGVRKGHLWIVHSADDEPQYVLRIYVDDKITSTVINSEFMEELREEILDTVVRGVQGIISAQVQQRNVPRADEFGTVVEMQQYYIITEGTNVAAVAQLPFVNPNMIISNALLEMEAMYGIMIARNRMIAELQGQVEGISFRHFGVYAAELSFAGFLTPMNRHGNVKRSKSFMQHSSEARPKTILVDTAIKAAVDTLDNVSSGIMLGKPPRLGTKYNEFIMDMEYMQQRLGDTSSIIASL